MINEVIEVKEYLSGKNINKKILYRICYLLAKWYKEEGLSQLEIRDAIFSWGKKHDVFIKYSVNNIIYKVLEDKTRLKDNISIKINKADIEEINRRFDKKNTKLTALALLCYAKACANRDKEFDISSVALSNWLGINSGDMSTYYLREVIDFEYITKISTPSNTFKWDTSKQNSGYRINVDIHNSGNYTLKDNDILDLYFQIFC